MGRMPLLFHALRFTSHAIITPTACGHYIWHIHATAVLPNLRLIERNTFFALYAILRPTLLGKDLKLTTSGNFVYWYIQLVSHKSDDTKDYKSGKDTCATVDKRNEHRISERQNKLEIT